MDIDLSKFHQTFFDESLEMLADMEEALLSYQLDTPIDTEKINRIFRAAHSIKGGSATFSFNHIRDFSHAMEGFLTKVRSGHITLSQLHKDMLLRSIDCLREAIQDLKNNRPLNTEAMMRLQKQFDQLAAGKTDSAIKKNKASEESADNTSIGWKIVFFPHENIFHSGNDPLRFIQALKKMGELKIQLLADQLPLLNELDPVKSYLGWNLILQGNMTHEEIENVFAWVNKESKIEIIPLDSAEIIPKRDQTKKELTSSARSIAESSSIRVSTEKIDALINLIGELVITRSALTQLFEEEKTIDLEKLKKTISQLDLNCNELQQYALQIRMLPISSIFYRFQRMVHDFARQLGKEVELQIEGETTEIDKSMLEKLVDPLQHLLRNAIDHGIEKPELRTAEGKSPKGIIKLSAAQQSGNIVITISDDGSGLPREKIVAKAIAQGLLNKQHSLSNAEIDALIFKPGFSTLEQPTDISGRGVGLDVVMQNIRSLGGNVLAHSTPGVGTIFTLWLPLTLAIMDCQLVRVQEEIYIIPINVITDIIKVKKTDIKMTPDHKQLYSMHESYIPIFKLQEILNMSGPIKNNQQEVILIFLKVQNKAFGLIVDELLTQQSIVIKSVENNYKKIEGISAATILGNGQVALIFDPNYLLRYSQLSEEIKYKKETAMNNEMCVPDITQLAQNQTLQVLSFKLAEQDFAINILDVLEIRPWEMATPLPHVPNYIQGLINLRGLIIPLINLHLRFKLLASDTALPASIIILKCIEKNQTRLAGVIVDEVSSTYNLTDKQIQTIPTHINNFLKPFLSGLVTINNKMLVLLNTHCLLAMEME